METSPINKETYPLMHAYVSPVRKPTREIIGREQEKVQIKAGLARPELSNILLLAQAGIGKSTLVEAVAQDDISATYMEMDVALMISDLRTNEELASIIKMIFNEAEAFVINEKTDLVLFMDEFHQIAQISASAVEAIKPVLAQSGTRGIKVIAATTYEEFHEWIAPNQPLMERLQRINLAQPDKATTLKILEGMAKRYGVYDQLYGSPVYELIYEYTNRYQESSAQPRKSILLLDAMVGWHRETGRRMNVELLQDVLQLATGIDAAFRVDGAHIEKALNAKVLSQQYAVRQVARRLQLTTADLHDKSKPMASFLFTGSTGTGKGTLVNEDIPVFDPTGSVAWKKAGNLVPGDQTFTREGAPQKVLGVFPQPAQDLYKVMLSDGRSLITDGPHLWGVYPSLCDRSRGLTVLSTETLALRLAEAESRKTRKLRYSIPMNQPVQWPEADLPVAPYALGALIADGALTASVQPLVLSSDDEFIVAKVAEQIGAVGYDRLRRTHGREDGLSYSNYNWYFRSGKKARRGVGRVAKKDIIGDIPELMNVYSSQRRVPERYLTASVEQRWELVRGLFDSDGHIGGKDGGRFNISYATSSKGLAEDVRHLLYSLGVIASISFSDRHNGSSAKPSREYRVHVRSQQADKHRFFSLPRKLEIAARAAEIVQTKPFDTDYVDIVSVTKLDRQEETVCIYVDHPEHLYQAGRDFIVTHNTELTKQMAHLLFGDDQRHLIRFDMSEFSEHSSIEFFRTELTKAVWNMGNAIILLDEIEKADLNVVRLLLQVLDDGRLTDMHGRTVSFLNTYIVMTTNAGKEIYRIISTYDQDDSGSGDPMKERMSEIRRSLTDTAGFPPELLGRIDTIVPFQPLSPATQRSIIMRKMKNICIEIYTKHRVKIDVDPRVAEYLTLNDINVDSDEGGARRAIAKLTDEFTTEIAQHINTYPEEKHLRVEVEGVLRSDNKANVKTKARIVVGKVLSY